MTIADTANVSITQDSTGIRAAGFGTPGILSHNASFPERSRSYSDLSGMVTDGFAVTSPEYLAAAAIFAQERAPETIKILRAALSPTQRYSLSVATVRNSHTYQLRLFGEGVTDTTVEYTSDSDATDGEIVAGLVSAINGVVGKNFTAAGSASPFTITADAAGDWFGVEILDVTDISGGMNHADPGVATDLAAILLEDTDWYCLYTLYNSEAYVNAAAGWVESNGKVYIADTNATASITAAAGGGDLLDDLATSALTRTAGIYHHDPSEFAGARWFGRLLPEDPGSATWAYWTLAGLSASVLTTTHKTNLKAKNASYYITGAGARYVYGGNTADGGWLDIRTGLDWFENDMTVAVVAAILAAKKIPYTDEGIAQIEAEVRGSIQRAQERGIIALDPEPVITVPKAANVSTANKEARTLPDVRFSATLAGAVHKVNITGVVSA